MTILVFLVSAAGANCRNHMLCSLTHACVCAHESLGEEKEETVQLPRDGTGGVS